MICTLSKHAAEQEGYNDALMLDWRGQIAEATGANVFLVQDGKIHTPTPDCFLDGITRRRVMDLARKAGIPVIERAIMPEELATTQEVFITGTAAEVTPVAEIGPHRFQVGQVTQRMVPTSTSWCVLLYPRSLAGEGGARRVSGGRLRVLTQLTLCPRHPFPEGRGFWVTASTDPRRDRRCLLLRPKPLPRRGDLRVSRTAPWS